MIVENRISILRMLRQIWLRLIVIAVFAFLSVAPLIYFELIHFAIDRSIPLIIGTAIAIFLGFRTNSAYERWWEARILWGRIVNDSLNLGRDARDLIGFDTPDAQQIVRQICNRQTAWAYTLDCQLKETEIEDDLAQFLQPTEMEVINRSTDPSLELLLRQGQSTRIALKGGLIDSVQCNLLQEILARLTEHMGSCNRIKSTKFPVHYVFFTKAFIWIFLLLLGFSLPSYEVFDQGLDHSASYIAIPAIFLIGWVFLTVDGIGDYMQSPFENNRNVVPMRTLARKIDIGLRMTMGDADLPPALEPVDGVLY